MPRECVVKSLNSPPRASTRARVADAVAVVVDDRSARCRECVDRANAIQMRRANPTVTRVWFGARASRGALVRVEICVRKRVVRSRRRVRRPQRAVVVRGVDGVEDSRAALGTVRVTTARRPRSRCHAIDIAIDEMCVDRYGISIA